MKPDLDICGLLDVPEAWAAPTHPTHPEISTLEIHLNGQVLLDGKPYRGLIFNYALGEHYAVLAKVAAAGVTTRTERRVAARRRSAHVCGFCEGKHPFRRYSGSDRRKS